MRKNILLLIVLSCFIRNNLSGQYWSTLGTGVGWNYYYSSVNSLASHNGELYAGGNFSTAGSVSVNNIAKWNGTTWSDVGNGIEGTVYSLLEFNGELYAGGWFQTAGGATANNIAKWNGSNWINIGSSECNLIKSLAVYNGELYAAGHFNFPGYPGYPYGSPIAKWNGTNWSAFGPQSVDYTISIECMAVYNGELYAAGSYYQIGGGGVPEFYRISKWNGSDWITVLTIPATYTLDGALGDILSMTVYNGELYASGNFGIIIDSIPAYHIAKWNGTNWSAAGSGINPASWPYGFDGSTYSYVKTLSVYNGSLYAGGRFDSSGTIATRNIAKWDGTNWSALAAGVDGRVYSLVASDSSLYTGGWFFHVNGNSIPASRIAKWNESCNAAPPQPIIINGNDTVCRNTQQIYFVNDQPGTSSYTWTLPPGWTGNSTTNSITVVVGNTSGTISVISQNNCGNSIAQTLNVTVLANTVPVIQSTITGNHLPCSGSAQTYFIAPVSNTTDYLWTLPYGWTGNSTDTIITATTAQTGGLITVRANNECGSSIPQVLSVAVVTAPQKPEFIYGDRSVCIGTSHLYHITPSQFATNYTWMLPQGWTGNSSTDSIIITASNTSGNIFVNAYNSCGISTYETLHISVDSIPQEPGNIIGNIYTTIHDLNYYSITPVSGASGYIWSEANAVIQGQNTNSISAIWKNAGVFELSVQAKNKCGMSNPQKITINVSDFDQNDPFDLQVFPNPSGGDLYVKAKRIQSKMINVEVLTISGQVLYRSARRFGSNNYTQFIDLRKLMQGTYVLKIIIDDKVYTKKIVIAK